MDSLPRPGLPPLSPALVAARIRDGAAPRLLDVRETFEHEFVALPGSRLIPLGELEDRLDELADWREQEIVVYCHHGVRSAHAVGLLLAAGFPQARNLSGGIDRWSLEADPTLPRY